jgi:hypothetical protein
MNKAPSHLSALDSRSAGLARVCLALAKTDSRAACQCRNQGKTIGADLNRHPLAILFLTTRHARPGLRHDTIPIAEAAQRLRGLVQPRFIP